MGSVYGTLETTMLHFLGNRDDDSTKAMLMTTFNWYQYVLANATNWEALERHALKQLTASNVVEYVSLETDEGGILLEGSTGLPTSVAASYMFSITTDLELTDFKKFYTIKLYDLDRYYPPLGYITPIKWDEAFSATLHMSAAKPEFYTIRGDYILFNCVPEAGLSLDMWYYAYPTVVTSTLSVLSLPVQTDQILMALAVGTVWLGLEEPDLSSKWLKLGSQFLKDAGIDQQKVLNMEASSKLLAQTGSSATPWADPFVRR